MKTEPFDELGVSANRRSLNYAAIRGVDTAVRFARSGRLISAIKLIESANPGISRKTAKAVVRSFGYDSKLRWPEEDRGPLRCL
jgi:hypothetical protein